MQKEEDLEVNTEIPSEIEVSNAINEWQRCCWGLNLMIFQLRKIMFNNIW